MLAAERSVLGIDHTQVGRALAQHWKFPELIQRSIGNHHAPMGADLGEIPSVVHVANVIVHALDIAGVSQHGVSGGKYYGHTGTWWDRFYWAPGHSAAGGSW
jgi:HD-like signal output (HDOD) protein